jgi:hypothetical protein
LYATKLKAPILGQAMHRQNQEHIHTKMHYQMPKNKETYAGIKGKIKGSNLHISQPWFSCVFSETKQEVEGESEISCGKVPLTAPRQRCCVCTEQRFSSFSSKELQSLELMLTANEGKSLFITQVQRC